MAPYRSAPLHDEKPVVPPTRWGLRIAIAIMIAVVASLFAMMVFAFGSNALNAAPVFIVGGIAQVHLIRRWNDPHAVARYQANVQTRAAAWMRSVR